MENKKHILDELKKSQKPSVPEGFFNNFADELSAKISEKESGLDAFNKSEKPEVPEGFFDNFSDQLLEKVQSTTADKPSRIIALKVMGFVTAVAACLLVMFTLIPAENEGETAETIIEESTEIITTDELMAYMDEDEIIDFIAENEDIEIESESASDEDVFYFLEEDIEDYYLEEEL